MINLHVTINSIKNNFEIILHIGLYRNKLEARSGTL